MSEEIAALYVSIGADFSQLQIALEETRATLESMGGEGGLLGGLPSQVPSEVQRMVSGVQTALAPLPAVLEAGLRQPITAALAAIKDTITREIDAIIAQLHAAARSIHAVATGLGLPSPVNVAALEGRASGGPVEGGSAYLVGEAGPELFVPGSSGQIIPNHLLAGGEGVTIRGGTFNIYGVQDVESLYDELQRVAQQRG